MLPAMWDGDAVRMLVIDAANVIGSRPSGWWRPARRSARRFTERVRATVAAGRLDPPVTVVLEGQARAGADEAVVDGVEVVHAPGEGDATIVAVAEAHREVVVVTADRKLAERVRAADAKVVGPSWLLDQLVGERAGGGNVVRQRHTTAARRAAHACFPSEATTSPSSAMRARSGSVAARTSSAVYLGVMNFGQFQSNATTSTVTEPFEPSVDAELLERRGVRLGVEAGVTQQLQAGPVGIVDRDDRGAVVAVEVASGDVLPVAGPVRPGQVCGVEHPDEAGGTTAVLHVPAIVGDRRDVEAVPSARGSRPRRRSARRVPAPRPCVRSCRTSRGGAGVAPLRRRP